MRVVFERVTNKLDPGIKKERSISDTASKLAEDILSGMRLKGNAVRSLTRAGGSNRKGLIILYLPESVRAEVRRIFDLSMEPSEFAIQCKSGKNTDDAMVTLVTIGFSNGGNVIDSIDDWLIEEPIDGREVDTILRSNKLDYALKQISEVLKDIRGRQRS